MLFTERKHQIQQSKICIKIWFPVKLPRPYFRNSTLFLTPMIEKVFSISRSKDISCTKYLLRWICAFNVHIYGHLRPWFMSRLKERNFDNLSGSDITFVSISRRHLLPGLLGRQSTGQFRTNLKSFKFSLKMALAATKMVKFRRDDITKWKIEILRSNKDKL